MSDFDERDGPFGAATRRVNGQTPEFAFLLHRRKNGALLEGLVVNADEPVRRKLGEILRECGIAPIFVSSVAESAIALAGHEVCVAFCNDRLADGNYGDVVKLVGRSETKVPVIVVSRTGDWPEYLTAISAGAFDYLAYPPIAGDLQRIVRNALLEHKRQRHLEGA